MDGHQAKRSIHLDGLEAERLEPEDAFQDLFTGQIPASDIVVPDLQPEEVWHLDVHPPTDDRLPEMRCPHWSGLVQKPRESHRRIPDDDPVTGPSTHHSSVSANSPQ